MVNVDHIFYSNPCPQSVRITTYQSAYILWKAADKSSIFPTNTFSPRHYYKTTGQSEAAHVRQRIKILMAWINYTMGLLRIQFYSVRQSKTNNLYSLIHFLFKFNKNLVNLSLGDVQSRIHFRTNTFDIWSHLADRETTDARYIYIHACSTVELLT
jgi:hypothetical protein